VLPIGEGVLETGRQVARRLVTSDGGIVGGHHDGAQIAEIELVEIVEGALGAVLPLRHAQPRQQLFRPPHHPGRRPPRLAFGAQRRVLLVDRLTYGRDATAQDLLGHRPLLGRQVVQHFVAMGPYGAEPLGLGPHRKLGNLGTRGPRRPGRTLGAGPAGRALSSRLRPGAPVGSLRALAGRGAAVALASGSPGRAVAVGTGAALTVAIAIAIAALAPRTVGPGDERLGHRLEARRAAEQFDALGFFAGPLRREDGGDRDPFEIEVGVRAPHRTALGPARPGGTVEDPPWVACPRGAPRPRAVRARAREL